MMMTALLHLIRPPKKVASPPASVCTLPEIGQVSVPKVADSSTTVRAWYALPGMRLELADTGFIIQMSTNPDEPLFTLITPEGRTCATSQQLPPLKEWAEKNANWRDEFTCHAPGTAR